MHLTTWNTETALKLFASRAAVSPSEFGKRFDWTGTAADGSDGFTEAEVDALYAEIIAKIPENATKVLDLGCGDGRFAAALRTARPAIGYIGVDVVPANVDTAVSALPSVDFRIGNLWEFLAEATMEWDFVVSIGCAFQYTDARHRDALFRLIDAKSPKGFFILCHHDAMDPAFTEARMAEVMAASVGVTASYASGDRDFLLDPVTKGIMVPVFVHRDSTATVAPPVPEACRIVATGRMNQVLARVTAKAAVAGGLPVPATFEAVVATGGLVQSREAGRTLPPEQARVRPANP